MKEFLKSIFLLSGIFLAVGGPAYGQVIVNPTATSRTIDEQNFCPINGVVTLDSRTYRTTNWQSYQYSPEVFTPYQDTTKRYYSPVYASRYGYDLTVIETRFTQRKSIGSVTGTQTVKNYLRGNVVNQSTRSLADEDYVMFAEAWPSEVFGHVHSETNDGCRHVNDEWRRWTYQITNTAPTPETIVLYGMGSSGVKNFIASYSLSSSGSSGGSSRLVNLPFAWPSEFWSLRYEIQ